MGIVTTVAVQSSSVVTVFLVTMVNTQLLTLRNTVGVVFGANIGTTLTAQMVAFNIGLYALPLIAAGFLVNFLGRSPFQKYLGEALLGVGFIFLGMVFMNSGVKPLQDSSLFMQMLKLFGDQPFWGIISGAVFTGIIQASSATIALVLAMATQGIINLQAAVAITLGANIGTCVTALLASIGTSRNAKRVAVIHLSFNVIGTAIMFFPLKYFVQLVQLTASDLPHQIANAHTIFNILTTIVLLPFTSALIFISKKIVPGEEYRIQRLSYLDRKTLKVPSLALESVGKELNRMAETCLSMLSHTRKMILDRDKGLSEVVENEETSLDEMHHSLDHFLTELSGIAMSRGEYQKLAGLTHAVTDIERIGDHIHSIAGVAVTRIDEKLIFSEPALQELMSMFDEVDGMCRKALNAFMRGDKDLAKEVMPVGRRISAMEDEYTKHHIERLEKGICSAKAGILFVGLLTNLERIGAHAENIAGSVIFGF